MKKQSKNRQGNGSVLGAVVAAICIIIYLSALVQASVRFYLSIEERKLTADREFSMLAETAQSTSVQNFMDERYRQNIRNALTLSRSIEAIIIKGPNGEFAFEKQEGRAVDWVNNSPRFKNRISFSATPYYKPLAIGELRNVNIMAVAGAFDFAVLSRLLKETLLIIMVGFAIAFFTMILQMLIGKPAQRSAPAYVSGGQDEYWEDTGKNPKGLYSSRSNIGWEEYTKDRLDSELHRCSSSEKDLTFILMEFSDLTNDNMYRQAAEEAASYFRSRDLLFEYGRQGISAILPGVDLEAGISRSEKFHQRIMEKFPPSYGNISSIFIGLSARSGRLLDADRLILEAKEALRKAKTDTRTSIIAFKSDLEKYRDFVRKQA